MSAWLRSGYWRCCLAELAEEVRSLLRLHDVSLELSTSWGLEIVQYCPTCGYIGEELHTENIVIEYLRGAFENET